MLWIEVVPPFIGGLIGAALSQWLGYRDGKRAGIRESQQKLAASRPSGPYRTAFGMEHLAEGLRTPTEEEPEEEPGWLYDPQTSCPRCDEDNYIQHRGRFKGEHDLALSSKHISHVIKCTRGAPDREHCHHQCYSCGADWAEIPPEDYDK